MSKKWTVRTIPHEDTWGGLEPPSFVVERADVPIGKLGTDNEGLARRVAFLLNMDDSTMDQNPEPEAPPEIEDPS